jgi:hypothetical protein
MAAAGNLRSAASQYSALAVARSRWLGWEAEPYGLLAPLEEARIDDRLGDTTAARVAYTRIITQ